MLFSFFLFLSLFCFLCFPKSVITGASYGLLLWYKTLLPTLFPFIVINTLILRSRTLDKIPNQILAPFRGLFHTSSYGILGILIGYLCGCPAGAQIIGEMVNENLITKKEGQRLLQFCVHISPMYLITIIYPKCALPLHTFLILLYGVPLFYGVLLGILDHKQDNSTLLVHTPENTLPFSIYINDCLLNSLEIIAKVGGYVILCSVYLNLLKECPIIPLSILSSLEITNGVFLLHSTLPLIALSSFGGWCMYLQIHCVINQTGLSLKKCIKAKLCLTFIIVLLTYFIIR